MKPAVLVSAFLLSTPLMTQAQQTGKPEATEVWEPVPKSVAATPSFPPPPADALVLFNGKDLSQWVSTENRAAPAKWKVAGGLLTVDKANGNIETKQTFTNYQLHLEWRIPATIEGTGQVRGNSGVFLASLGKGDLGYELQILDSYQNKTYVNGMAGSIYKQHVPLANPARKPGEWQSYDVLWTAPVFKADGSVQAPARVTVLFNGVVVQHNVALSGPTLYIGQPSYQQAHGPTPIKLQAHGDKSEPISYRNIWVRKL
ncbi:DUF1080 domain-containing protein [Hymenobacter sp. 5516J-16]|uniref:DUF1080 domain-containing protein n=1 Tax=Hymenobacter sublimis TaxID=2933777 RepID=A0ABY4J5S8_9BACT|nr:MULTISPECIES: DUF1080 domain-containing protein [Hymenobacter]UOQ77762.1 DUF1080 domain-containing protein [Hymenobacter sp. 5516J-16]UPL47746.1 DUF1080 domain-containing protein [Hymenobacter sublimis]